jgi:flagellar biosynthesis/type III secretory pathway M-ring protein FliF/YscJ
MGALVVLVSLNLVILTVGFLVVRRLLDEVIRAEAFKSREAYEKSVQRFEKAVSEHGCPLGTVYKRFAAMEKEVAEMKKSERDTKISLDKSAKMCIMLGRKVTEQQKQKSADPGVNLPLNA